MRETGRERMFFRSKKVSPKKQSIASSVLLLRQRSEAFSFFLKKAGGDRCFCFFGRKTGMLSRFWNKKKVSAPPGREEEWVKLECSEEKKFKQSSRGFH